MAKTSMKVKQQRAAKYSTRAYNRCKICGRPHAYLRKYAVSASESSLTRAKSPELKSHLGKILRIANFIRRKYHAYYRPNC